MSHVALGELIVKTDELPSFVQACSNRGLQFMRNQTTWNWFGTWMNDWSDSERAAALQGIDPATFGKGDHAVKVPGSDYEIGLQRLPDGSGWRLVYDAWGGDGKVIEAAVGMGCRDLKVEHGMCVAESRLQRQGYRTSRETAEDGRLRVRAQSR
jgi:hypothetical protein